MTVITVAQTSTGFCLVADAIYNPFESPKLMVASKLVERDGFLIGISGRIVNNGVHQLLEKPDAFLDYKYDMTDTHIILITPSSDIYILKCNDEHPTWYRPLAMGEPPMIGCFSVLFNEGLRYGEVPTLSVAIERIAHLHRAYGFTAPPTSLCVTDPSLLGHMSEREGQSATV